jgi:hypothetical protein
MKALLILASVFAAATNLWAESIYQISDAEGVIMTTPTSGQKFELRGVQVGECEVLSGGGSLRSHFCGATAGELVVENASAAAVSYPIEKVLIYESESEGVPVQSYQFRTLWTASTEGYEWSSMAWIYLSNYESPEGELTGRLDLRRFNHSYPIVARWRR